MIDMETQYTRPDWRTRLAERVRTARFGLRPATIRYNESGLTATVFLRDGSVSIARVKWSEVNGVVAFKRDAYIVDLICMGFTTAEGSVEVNEEMEGWGALTDALPLYLPGTPSPEDWWNGVAQPPFAANPTTLFTSR
jgi:hypothetical protein